MASIARPSRSRLDRLEARLAARRETERRERKIAAAAAALGVSVAEFRAEIAANRARVPAGLDEAGKLAWCAADLGITVEALLAEMTATRERLGL